MIKSETNTTKLHVVLCAPKKTGKSTLIRRIIQEAGAPAAGSPMPVCGFLTKRFAGPGGIHRIYMLPAGRDETDDIPPDARYLGSTCGRVKDVCTETFDTYGTALIQSARPGGLLIMDEIGHMEKDASLFLRAVFEALDGDVPILASVRYTAAGSAFSAPADQAGSALSDPADQAGSAFSDPADQAGSVDYLERIKHHPRVRLYMLTGENREGVYAEVRNHFFGGSADRKEEKSL